MARTSVLQVTRGAEPRGSLLHEAGRRPADRPHRARRAGRAIAAALVAVALVACADATDDDEADAAADTAAVDALPLPDSTPDAAAPIDTGPIDTDVTPCAPACGSHQCGPDGCGGICGLCATGQTCNVDGLCVESGGKQPFGAACGPTDACSPPGDEQTGDQPTGAWPACLDAQCATGACHVPYCTRPCQFAKDSVDNVTGDTVADGIEDEDVPNSCSDAADGPVGTAFRCVNVAPSTAIDPIPFCVPGTTFAACARDADCPDGEVCDALTVDGETGLRCQGAAKSPTAPVGSHCSLAGGEERPLCAAPFLCTSDGCTAYCADDADCLTAGAACNATTGACKAAPDHACESDADCSEWRCQPDSPDAPIPGAGRCVPKTCEVDADCGTPGFLCRTHASFDQVPPVWSHTCVMAPPEATATLGEACTNNPADALLCDNPDLCYKGQCSAHCLSDADCATAAGGQTCSTAEIPFDVDADALLDAILPLAVCEPVPHEGPMMECGTDLDCPAGEVCTPLEGPAPEGAPYPYQIHQVCRSMPESFGAYGSTCGSAPGEGECRIGFCITDDVLHAVPDLCSRTCTAAADCPSKVTIEGTDHPSVCRSVIYGWNGTVASGDDLYVPVCWPVAPESSLLDCAGDLSCGATDHACVAWPIATDPTEPGTVEYLCISNRGADGEPAKGQLGDACTGPQDCASLLCLPDTTPGAGYCAGPCQADVDCLGGGPFMVCDPHVAVDRGDDALDLITPQCRMARSCLPCEGDTDCVAGQVCVNIGGKSYVDLRCAPACETDGDCKSTDGGPTCEASISPTGVADGVKACMPPSCDQR